MRGIDNERRLGRTLLAVGGLLALAAALLFWAMQGREIPAGDLVTSQEAETDTPEPAEVPDQTSAPPSTAIPAWLADLEARQQSLPEDAPSSAIDESSFDAVVRPGESIQSVVDELPEGSSILIKSGTHVGQRIRPKSGMVFVGEEGAVMDGEGRTEYAFIAWEENEIDNVTIRGLEIMNYAPIPAMAAITSHRSGWVVEDCHIHHTRNGSAIRVNDNSVIRDCVVHHNDRLGLKPAGDNILVERNEVYSNNHNDINDPTWEAGGIKSGGDGIVFRDNHIYDNHGPGIWIDIDAIHILYEDNLIENNTHSGINHEISFDALIRNNTIRNNGHGDPRDTPFRAAGIYIRGPNVDVYGNTVEDNRAGIILIENDRGSGERGPYTVKDVDVYGNVVVNSGPNGAIRFTGSSDLFATSRFDNNTYRYSDSDRDWWHWEGNELSWEQWQEIGNDVNGVLQDLGG